MTKILYREEHEETPRGSDSSSITLGNYPRTQIMSNLRFAFLRMEPIGWSFGIVHVRSRGAARTILG